MGRLLLFTAPACICISFPFSSRLTVGGVLLRAATNDSGPATDCAVYPTTSVRSHARVHLLFTLTLLQFQIPKNLAGGGWLLRIYILTQRGPDGTHYLHASKGIYDHVTPIEDRFGVIPDSKLVNPLSVELTANDIQQGRYQWEFAALFVYIWVVSVRISIDYVYECVTFVISPISGKKDWESFRRWIDSSCIKILNCFRNTPQIVWSSRVRSIMWVVVWSTRLTYAIDAFQIWQLMVRNSLDSFAFKWHICFSFQRISENKASMQLRSRRWNNRKRIHEAVDVQDTENSRATPDVTINFKTLVARTAVSISLG